MTHGENTGRVLIKDEYNSPVRVADFFATVVDSAPNGSDRQITWLRNHGYTIAGSFETASDQDDYWLDGNRLFSRREFS